jgi:hypothetical protein
MPPILKFFLLAILLLIGFVIVICLRNSPLFMMTYLFVGLGVSTSIRCPSCRTPLLWGWKWYGTDFHAFRCLRCKRNLAVR